MTRDKRIANRLDWLRRIGGELHTIAQYAKAAMDIEEYGLHTTPTTSDSGALTWDVQCPGGAVIRRTELVTAVQDAVDELEREM